LDQVIPKSTATLKEGDFCFIPRSDGKYVPFVYLFQYSKARTSIYCGVVNTVVNKPDVSELPAHLEIRYHAVLHIKCFKENNTPIVGNIADRIGDKVLKKIKADVSNMKVGSTIKVWGYNTIFKYADEISG
jgi:hypothetical protein